jgi:hypothetical protein
MPIQPSRVYSCIKDSLNFTFINITVFWDIITFVCVFIVCLTMLTAWAVVVGVTSQASVPSPPVFLEEHKNWRQKERY